MFLVIVFNDIRSSAVVSTFTGLQCPCSRWQVSPLGWCSVPIQRLIIVSTSNLKRKNVIVYCLVRAVDDYGAMVEWRLAGGSGKESSAKLVAVLTSEALTLTWSFPGLNLRLPSTKPA
jgi:hypothetical protein